MIERMKSAEEVGNALAEYLKEENWKEYPTKRKHVRVFSNLDFANMKSGEHFLRVDIPMSRELSDYEEALNRCLWTILFG